VVALVVVVVVVGLVGKMIIVVKETYDVASRWCVEVVVVVVMLQLEGICPMAS